MTTLKGIELLPVTEPKAVAENFRRIEEFLSLLGGSSDPHSLQAALVGGEAITAAIDDSTVAGEDTAIEHGLGRVPSQVLLETDTMGLAGRIYAAPEGGDPALGQNDTPWTADRIYLRATVASTYRFVVT